MNETQNFDEYRERGRANYHKKAKIKEHHLPIIEQMKKDGKTWKEIGAHFLTTHYNVKKRFFDWKRGYRIS